MYQKKFEEVNRSLDFARHNMNGLVALFGYKNNSMVYGNKTRALSMADVSLTL